MNTKQLKFYSVGEAARACGCSSARLYIYESLGVVTPARAGGQRVYTPEDISTIQAYREQLHGRATKVGQRRVAR